MYYTRDHTVLPVTEHELYVPVSMHHPVLVFSDKLVISAGPSTE